MTTENKRDFAADRAICDAATSGPWNIRISYYGGMRYDVRSARFDLRLHNEPDARFIAEARNGWPAALDEIERLTHLSDLLRGQLAETTARLSEDVARMADEIERLRKVERAYAADISAQIARELEDEIDTEPEMTEEEREKQRQAAERVRAAFLEYKAAKKQREETEIERLRAEVDRLKRALSVANAEEGSE